MNATRTTTRLDRAIKYTKGLWAFVALMSIVCQQCYENQRSKSEAFNEQARLLIGDINAMVLSVQEVNQLNRDIITWGAIHDLQGASSVPIKSQNDFVEQQRTLAQEIEEKRFRIPRKSPT